ncbi:helix-turn-helix domain-containing protein [Streptomyces sp. NPDC093509]|uniref:helix-turn-helix domain-containing protein n=1 Tax=Streptomyces sp. NPDC093509 TaxID=3154982 RepID=UPI00344E6F7B
MIDLQLTADQMKSAQKLLAQPKISPFSYLNDFRLPGNVPRGFKFQITGHSVGEIALARVQSDAVTGTGVGGNDAPLIIQVITSGGMIFESASQSVRVGKGQVGIRQTAEKWEVRCAPSTTSRLIIVPRALVSADALRKTSKGAFRFDLESPEMRFLASYLDLIEAEQGKHSSTRRDDIAQHGLASLVSNLIKGDSECKLPLDVLDPIVASARRFIAEHILDDDLSPSVIAKEVAVSVRNLHRSFAMIGSSVMSEVRQLRLEGAHDDLIAAGLKFSVSSVAAKWRFADSSHFVRQFKGRYGATPASYIRERMKNGETTYNSTQGGH